MADVSIEELDYHITFPSPTLLEANQDPEDNFVEPQINSTKEPVVILLGWAGCEEKHLKKYASLYDKRCITIQYTAPTQDLFYKQKNLRVAAAKILDLLYELGLEDNPIFFHAFSNGGGMVYWSIHELVNEKETYKNVNIVGSMFDSLPAERKLSTAIKALSATLKINFALKYIALFLFVVYTVLHDIFHKLFKAKTNIRQSYWQFMRNEPAVWPSLYLYSKADEIVSYVGVEETIEHRIKVLGADIKSVCWEESPHVQHYRYHREAYITQCHQFVDYCLKKSNN